jgi:hypothetical protein
MIRFTYLDDEPPEAVRPYVRALESQSKVLQVDHLPPRAYPTQMEALRERHREGKLDGLILDLRLDQFADWETGIGRADYRAATLAQEIRTRATEGTLPQFPIVLLSTDERLRRSYVNDDTSHDLFDTKTLKEQIEEPEGAARLASQLIALVEGYHKIEQAHSKKRGVNRGVSILGFEDAPVFLDPRVLTHFLGRDGTLPIHEVARFILRDLLDTPGPLIDADMFAARMGIDVKRSQDFDKVLTHFSNAKYSGAFADGWPRWWFAQVEAIWRSLGKPPTLRASTAKDRVSHLKDVLKLRDLNAAQATEGSSSTAFWTICQATRAPLDPRDGFLLDRQPTYPWQDRLYVSFAALADGTAKTKRLRIDPLETERFNRARTRLSVP